MRFDESFTFLLSCVCVWCCSGSDFIGGVSTTSTTQDGTISEEVVFWEHLSPAWQLELVAADGRW